MDLLLRQDQAAFRRETISFSKHFCSLIDKYALFMIYKNYMRPQFISERHKKADRGKQSPAMYLKLCKHILKFHEVFKIRKTLKQVKVCQEWQDFIFRKNPFKRQSIAPFKWMTV